jgi:hypothetical protein
VICAYNSLFNSPGCMIWHVRLPKTFQVPGKAAEPLCLGAWIMRANIILKLSEGMTPMEVVTAQSTSPKMVHRWPENIFFFFLVPTFLI